MKQPRITNRSHLGAYRAGAKARREGLSRVTPYKGNYVSKVYMEKYWLMGYDAKEPTCS